MNVEQGISKEEVRRPGCVQIRAIRLPFLLPSKFLVRHSAVPETLLLVAANRSARCSLSFEYSRHTIHNHSKFRQDVKRGGPSIVTKTQVLALLKENKNERGIANWKKLGAKACNLKSYGIGLTQLRKLAKQIGRDHKLAQQLWQSDIYDAKVIGLLIDEPKKLTREQAEEQVDGLHGGMLSHVFASCDATLAKTPFAFELAREWMDSNDDMRRRCGYSLLYELSKKKVAGMDDEFLLGRIENIQDSIHDEEMWVREAMNTALMGIGKRNRKLNTAAIRAVKAIGPVEIDYGDDNSCEPLDVLKHLTSDYLKKKLKA
jgi:3-methyladenine DNA glycosylase AlkD